MSQDRTVAAYEVEVTINLQGVNKYGDKLDDTGFLSYTRKLQVTGISGLSQMFAKIDSALTSSENPHTL